MIRDVLSSDFVKTEVNCSTWQDAVKEVGNILKEHGKVEESFIQSMIDTVNELGPYMILLPGLALFHGSPQAGVHEACLSFITFKEDVVFTEFDQQHIQCAFGFGAVDSDSHMGMLMQVAQLLQDEEFIELVRNHGSKEEIMRRIKLY
ncbi:MAG: PTS sugar transporter subunit IIA [Erysipelotrichaceae bacterium]